MKYSEARDLIQDGDIVSILRCKNSFSFFANTISLFTRSPIYHSAIAFWMETNPGQRRLFLAEADINSRRLVPLSTYEGHEMHVIAKPDEIDFCKFSPSLLENVAKENYSIAKAVGAGLRKYLLLPKLDVGGEICSELCIKMWMKGGFNYEGETLLTPDQLETKMIKYFGFKYRVVIDAT
jgi:hypothetical protein